MSANNTNETDSLPQRATHPRVRFSLLNRRTISKLALACAIFHLIIVPLMFCTFTYLLTPVTSTDVPVPYPWSDFATFFEWNNSYPSAEHEWVTNTLDTLIGYNTGHEKVYDIVKSGLHPRDDKLIALIVIAAFLGLFLLNARYRYSPLAVLSITASFAYFAFYVVVGVVLFWIRWNTGFLII